MLDDKDRAGILKEYRNVFDRIVLTRVPSPRMKDFDGFVALAKEILGNVDVIEDPLEALKIAEEKSVTVVSGSLFLVGYVREYLETGKIGEEWYL